MDTPGVQHSANYTGGMLQPAPPLYAPETTAEAIVRLVEHPRRQVVVGVVAKLAKLEYQLAPRAVEWGLARCIEAYLRRAEDAPDTSGNLDAPMPQRRACTAGCGGRGRAGGAAPRSRSASRAALWPALWLRAGGRTGH